MDWKQEMLWLTILYRIAERKEQIPVINTDTDYSFIDVDLNDMVTKELLSVNTDSGFFDITEKGKVVCQNLLAIYDHLLKFEIFSIVNVALTLDEDETDDEGIPLNHIYDRRFQEVKEDEIDELGSEDLRLAMIQFLAEEMDDEENPLKLDPHRVVFVQRLSKGLLNKKDIWFDFQLETVYNTVDEIVSSAYKWTDVAETKEDARSIMQAIYTAGMLEQRKRDGLECSECGIPLALFESDAKDNGETLEECPNPDCGASFAPPPPEFECPACGAGIYGGQQVCSCGALIDFGLPSGTVTTETTEETVYEEEPIWTDTYGYVPYGYYDPYDPFVNALAFGVVCSVLW
jgi:hypothetical protein